MIVHSNRGSAGFIGAITAYMQVIAPMNRGRARDAEAQR
jgi:hypothetical protein